MKWYIETSKLKFIIYEKRRIINNRRLLNKLQHKYEDKLQHLISHTKKYLSFRIIAFIPIAKVIENSMSRTLIDSYLRQLSKT